LPAGFHFAVQIAWRRFLQCWVDVLAALGPINQTTSRIIKAAIDVHRTLGPGLLEAVYFSCLLYELRTAGLKVECEKRLPITYKGVMMDCFYKLDLLVEDLVVVEIKVVEYLLAVHKAQLLTEMKLSGKPVGLLLNFNVPVMKDGVTRLLNRSALETV
jgi:GxxExxY protein